MKTIPEAAAWLRGHDDYLILTHRRPDGDAVGSAVALCLGLRQLGKRAELFPNAQFTEKFHPLYGQLLGSESPEGRTVIAVDTAAQSMLPYNGAHLADTVQFCLDHHESNEGYAPGTYVDARAGACGELVYLLLAELQVELTQEMAEAIYVAVSTDTGCFRFTNTTPQTLLVAAACLSAGADTAGWNRVLFLTKTAARLRLEAYLTQNAKFFMGGRIALCALPRETEQSLGLTEDDLDDISGFPRDIEGVEIGVMLREVADGTKVSLRTYAPWNASDICKILGGGGHRAAAGATVKCSLQDAAQTVLDALRQYGAEV